jgi:hypothetical protein
MYPRKDQLRRATRYLSGEASTSGYRTGEADEAPPGYQGRHVGKEDVSTGESDGVIVCAGQRTGQEG